MALNSLLCADVPLSNYSLTVKRRTMNDHCLKVATLQRAFRFGLKTQRQHV